MSAKLLEFCIYGMNDKAIGYVPMPGSNHKPFILAIDDKDLQSIPYDLDIRRTYVTFGALSSMITRGVVRTCMTRKE